MMSLSMKQRLAGKKSLKTKWMQKESVSKQGRKPAKAEPTMHKDLAFDDLDDDAIDYIETKDLKMRGGQAMGCTDKRTEGTNKQDRGTDSTKVSTDRQDEGTADQNKGKSATQIAPTTTLTPTPTIFGDDETISQVLITMNRPRDTSTRSVLTLKPLPKIDPKYKGKKVLKEEAESDAESEGVDEAERKINADKILAEELQKEEIEKFTIEQSAKFLHDTIAVQRKFLT
ncbi:hypothetical protein Tco_1156041 [Tanacetum coccineum]